MNTTKNNFNKSSKLKKNIGAVKQNTIESLTHVFDRAHNAKDEWANLRLTQRARILRFVRKNTCGPYG